MHMYAHYHSVKKQKNAFQNQKKKKNTCITHQFTCLSVSSSSFIKQRDFFRNFYFCR